MKPQVRLDYEKLATSYRENLLTILRGFTVEPDSEFLETWVPDQDDAGSIIGLVEAAENGGLDELTIFIGQGSLRALDLPALKLAAGRYGRVQTAASGDGLELQVVLTGGAANPEPIAAPVVASAKPASVASDLGSRRPAPAVRLTRQDDGVLPAGYARALEAAASSFSHEGALGAQPGAELLEATITGATLAVLVDPSDHRVKAARHHGGGSDQRRKLLDLLCRGVEGRPAQEAVDHAVVRLEHSLRGGLDTRSNPGIVLPKNVSSAFGELQDFLDRVLREYRQRQSLKTTKNFYDPAPSSQWQSMSDAERVAQIQATIDGHPRGKGLQVIRVEGLQRFVLGVADAAYAGVSGPQLLELEAHVKRQVEPTLYFEMQPRVDDNKLRRLNDKGATKS